jgi:hypothetical protein
VVIIIIIIIINAGMASYHKILVKELKFSNTYKPQTATILDRAAAKSSTHLNNPIISTDETISLNRTLEKCIVSQIVE